MKGNKKPLTKEERRKKRQSSLTTWLLILVLLIGAGVMAYPTVSDWWNSFHASRAIASYSSAVENVDKDKLNAMLEEAHQYNSRILQKTNPYGMTEEELAEYNSLLDLSGTGVMGYITIKSIGVYIPIYHGTDESILQIAVGHIEWTSLPVGGESTHTVLSGHRGLPSAKLFTDLDQLREGDTFTITVLNQMITYQIDQIRIVEPGDIAELAIVPGKDYCTLVTCTPYGINTHRMLVRGVRVANESGELVVPAEAFRIPNYITIPAVGIPLLFLTLLALLIVSAVKRPKLKRDDIYRLIEDATEPGSAAAAAGRRDAAGGRRDSTVKSTENPAREAQTKPKAVPGTEAKIMTEEYPKDEDPDDVFPEDEDWFPDDDPEA